jgi:hypothetical protein
MGSFVLYILEWALCLLIFLVVYKVCFSGSTFHRFSRFYLLGSVVVAALLPLMHISIPADEEMHVSQLRIADTQFARQLSSANIAPALYQKRAAANDASLVSSDAPAQVTQGPGLAGRPSLWAVVLILAYISYVVFLVIGWTKSFFKMSRFIRGKPIHRLSRWIRIVVHDEAFGPFSWLNYVVISSREVGFARKASMLHEISHIRNGHAIDLAALLACSILNPVCWLVIKEIKIVHEYEADNDVINRYHIQKRDYQRLLIIRTVGAEAYALASSFNLNIKQRIKMMKKKQSTWWRMSCIILTVPVVGIALTAFAEPRQALVQGIDREANNIAVAVEGNAASSVPSMSETEIAQEATKAESADAADHNLKTGETVSGVVCGYNHPLKGASVTERDANGRIVNYAETNDKGQFSLKIKNPSNRLAVSYVGFHDFKCDLNQTDYQIKMEPSAAMDEVSVTAYYAKAADTPTSTQPKAPAMSEVFSIAEQMPVYPGGKEAWMQYVNSHIRYPAAAQNSGAQARIDVMFIVDRNGNVRSPKVERVTELSPLDEKLVLAAKNGEADAQDKVDAYNDGLESLKEEAVSILRHSSKWVPAQQNGNPVNCQYSIPIKFSLNHQVVIKPVKFPLLK